jgi:hypothetical protein
VPPCTAIFLSISMPITATSLVIIALFTFYLAIPPLVAYSSTAKRRRAQRQTKIEDTDTDTTSGTRVPASAD